ncbi:MAG: hypothetical protein JJU30_14280, partial [Alkalimonas sp.]|nr:hypothetical protein [Alkalimonas sp.]
YNKALASQRIDHPSREDLRQYFRQEFLTAGLLHEGQVGAGTSWYIPAADFYRHLQHLAEQGITIYSRELDGEKTL